MQVRFEFYHVVCVSLIFEQVNLSNEGHVFLKILRTWICQKISEAYNWVVSICLKYVSLPWIMVNSLLRGASEPGAWREFYKNWNKMILTCAKDICFSMPGALHMIALVREQTFAFLFSKIFFWNDILEKICNNWNCFKKITISLMYRINAKDCTQ